ncbi:hypothetical protein AMATHDRAFT_3854 [Amanita thiersii Skay4041]|uniref:Uncharacterized protein n=1 Tax=Amanita thiersii Skay4041 TaxID=703135 RepID=A0A2A9NSB9_9AGAR|nr:hypothetical protein AMATHDRAFT_3854 [Amanita thiersii Skay4041]
MAPATRRSSRKHASSCGTSESPTSASTPVFSSRNSIASETPMTTEVDEQDEEVEVPRKRARHHRVAATEKPGKEVEADSVALRRTSRRRVVNREVYVEVPVTKKAKNVVKNNDTLENISLSARNKDKGKGKAPVRGPLLVESDNENGGDLLLDESDGDSDPDFIVSEDDGHSSEDMDSEDEVVMLDAAVRMSIQTARLEARNGASSSTALAIRPSLDAARRAVLAERRFSRARMSISDDDLLVVVDDSDGDGSGDSGNSEISFPDDELSDTPHLIRRKKKAKQKGQPLKATLDKCQAAYDMVRERLALKAEEKTLSRKLGRKLTTAEKATIALNRYHPELKEVWGDLSTTPVNMPSISPQPENLKLTLLPFQRESLSWMQKQEQSTWGGGMLADEMGMGKTIQMISLIVTDGQKPNLVVAPTVAIMQWKHEVLTHTDGLKVLVWHGASRETNHKEFKKYDVVLTTCFRKQETGFKRKGVIVKEKSPVHQVKWRRIILDEAHNIKERATNTAKATFELQGEYRWCLSGTPLQNRVGELYSLVRFLGGDPFSYYFCEVILGFYVYLHCLKIPRVKVNVAIISHAITHPIGDCGHTPMHHTCFWNNEILTPIQKHGMVGPGEVAFRKLKILLDRMMLRRTKLQRADDLGLPPRTVIIRRDYFSPEEKELFLSLYSDAKRQFNTYLDQGTVLNNYSNIFSLLTRMRQMACHPDLVLRSKTNAQQFIQDDNGETTVCRICNDIAEDAIQSRCRHIFDRECIRRYLDSALESNPACPVCHLPLTIDLDAPALELEENVPNARQGILGRLNLDSWRSSTKIEALVEELSNLRQQDATTKSLVFSQFVNFLDLIAYRLQKAGFNICRLEGTMSPQARDATIQYFMNNVDVTVFLVSLKAGGVALNLTEASRVYLMDSWWNPAVEYQAMDRIHRLGQRRPVQAIKLVIEDSIEARIIQLQEKKSAMIDATLSSDESAMGRLTPEDLGFLFRNSEFSAAFDVALNNKMKQFTLQEVAKHNKEGDLWVVIDSKVYDISRFADLHPGGANVFYTPNVAGQDATQMFFGLHRHEVLLRPQYARLQIGKVIGQEEQIKPPVPGQLSKVPYAEPSWLNPGYFSPYYTNSHRKFQTAIRTFFETAVAPEAARCEESGKRIPQEVVDKLAESNIISMRLGPGKHLRGRTLMGGIVKPEEFDYFHEAIIHAELARSCSRALVDGMLAGLVIGLPPILNFGSRELIEQVVPETLAGKKYIALAISEAFAGSDVSGLQTTAVRDGDYWVINGTKKWITNGTFADYFTTGCKTENGFTVILIPRGPGVSTKQIKTAYSTAAGTAYVIFDKVRVPVANTLGKVGGGMSVILSNFNHERWMVTATSISAQRQIVEECLKWSSQRIVFGKPLTSQAVIRAKLASMIQRIEACQNWFETITHQMNNMNYDQMSQHLAGPIGLLKQFVSRCGRESAEDATQIFGGRGLTTTGMGKLVENYHRCSGFDAILAGAEDVLGDLGVRQALRKMPRDARL